MTGKPPKVKPVPAPIKIPEFSVDGTHRPPPGSSAMPHLSIPHHLETLPVSFGPDSIAVTPAIRVSVNPRSSAIDEFAMRAAKYSLADYWIPAPKIFGEADAQGIRIVKQRHYVAVADDHVVQVVLDAESGLFRATLASELDPSGPLLKPDNEGRFWGPLDSDVTPFTDSISVQTAELFRRMGRSVAQFSAAMVARVLAVSGVNEPVLRDVLMNDRPAPFLLEDTIRRFELDQTIQAQGRGAAPERFRRFKDLEDAFESDCDENTLRMRRVFPHLPKTAAQAIWRNMSAAERLHMHNLPGMPQRVAKEALVALREIRLARAVEGIHLEAVANPDSDRLVLHMLGNLANWPRQTRVEIRQRTMDGHVLSAIGDARSPFRHILIRQDDGYVLQNSDAQLPRKSKDLYSTIWFLLSPGHRQLLGVTEDGGAALQQWVRAQPLPSRQTVSELLGMAPLAVTVDPATAQHRQKGQLRGGGDNNPTSTRSVADRVRDLYPHLPDEEVTAFITERLKSDPSGILLRLEKEFATLRNELAIWNADGASSHTQTSEPEGASTLAERRQAREKFSAKLQDIWQRKSVSRWGEGDYYFSHYVDFSGELPRLSARFEYVAELILTANEPGARIGAFLDSFPNIQYLGVVGIKMEGFPSGIFQMRQLSELTLDGCSLKLSEVTAEGLSRIETLTRLNLANNPLTVAPHVGYMAGLTGLMLSNAHLSSVPSGIDSLRKLGVAALHDNNISDVGYELFEIPDTQDLFIGLLNNPLSDASRQRISQYLENSSMDRKVEIQTEEVVFESDSDSESSESGFSTGSDSD
ncbi:leucine-rich repeat domain-containing protein [Pseudomonas sp. H1_D05]